MSISNEEIWLPIKGYEGIYEISSCGNVRSLDRWINTSPKFGSRRKIKGKQLTPVNTAGYNGVSLMKDGKTYRAYIHRLVAETFIPNSKNRKEVNHKDFNRKNNNVENLEWVTHKENIQHSERGHRRRIDIMPAVLTPRSTIACSNGEIYNSIREASCVLHISRGLISRVCAGKKHDAKGLFFWKTGIAPATKLSRENVERVEEQ